MKKKIKNFCAGLTLTLLIPAFFGGQFATVQKIKEGMNARTEMAQQKVAPKEDLMDKAIAILP